MYIQLKSESQLAWPALTIVKPDYCINEDFLQRLGFSKTEALSGQFEWVYRYINPLTRENGIELVYLKEFNILSIDEFWIGHVDGGQYLTHTIVGKFKVCSDEDLQFIFTRNIRLNYIFNVASRRV